MGTNSIETNVFFIFVILLLKNSVRTEHIKCQSNCTCDWTNGVVNCTNLGLDKIPDFGNDASSIIQLNFGKNSLTKLEKDTFENFTNLTYLFLDFNKISDIEFGAFSRLTVLKEIKLNNNSLTKVKNNIFSNLKVETILLSHNKISTIEDNALTNLPHLTFLSLAYNNLLTLNASSFSVLPLLNSLYLRNNQFTEIPKIFRSKTPNLTFLLLNQNKISLIEDFAFAGCSNLTSLHMSGNIIRNIHEKGFYTKDHESNARELCLKTLNLEANQLDALPPAITFPASIEHLNLNDNLYGVVKPFSFRPLSNLINLHISNNRKLYRIESKAFAGLYSLSQIFITHNPKLTSIDDDAFLDSKNVETVFLGNNALENLSRNLLRWDKVKILQISSNNFTCSCGLIWIQSSTILQQSFTKDNMADVQCTLGKSSQYILSLDPSTLNCEDTKSRVITGLVAASIASCSLIVCLILISCRRKLYIKYIQFKYRRQRDDPLFTVEDPRGKRKMFSGKSILRNQNLREETLM